MSTLLNRFSIQWLLWLALLLGGGAGSGWAQGADYDVGRDFSTVSNPSGVWTMGWANTLTGPVTALTVRHDSPVDGGVIIPSWQLTHGEAPVVYDNTSGHAVSVASGLVQLPAQEVWVAPGQDGRPENFVVIQFTAPTNGAYTVATTVRPFYPGPPQGDADFHVVQNGTVLFSQGLTPAQSTAYTNTLALNAGDTIKFLLGRGADGREYGSVYRIAALINPGTGATNPPPPPPPPIVVVTNGYDVGQQFSSTANPNGVWLYGWSPTVGGPVTPLGVAHSSPTESGVMVPSWQLTPYWAPVVYANTASEDAVFGGGAVHMPPGAMWFAPGQDGRPENFTVIQFTAPASSNYLVNVAVKPVYPAYPQGDTDFHVVRNSEELFGVYLNPTQTASFSNVVALEAGETIRFVLGRGADGSEYGSILQIAARITPNNGEPTVVTNPPPPMAPVIVTQPSPYQSVTAGGAAQLSVVVWGDGTLNYQWLFLNTPVAGANGSSLLLTNLSASGAGSYRVVVNNDYGAVTSQVAVINVSSNTPSAGTVFFANGSTNRIYDVDGTNFVTAASKLVVGLFAGGAADDLHLVEPETGFLPVPGRFNGGTRTIPGTSPGQTVWMQVRVWDGAFGDSYEEATAAGGKRGASGLFQVRLGGSITPPPTLNAMAGFGLSLPGAPAPLVAASLPAAPTPVVLRRLVPTAQGWTLTLTGPTAATCAIETSSDLTNWETVAYVVNESGIVEYNHHDAGAGTGAGRKFYRVRLVNP